MEIGMEKHYKVRASHCHYSATEDEIYNALKKTTDPLNRTWEKLEKAKKVVLKLNMIKKPEAIVYFKGRRRELVDDAVMVGGITSSPVSELQLN